MDKETIDFIFNNIRTLNEAYLLDDEFRIVQQESFNLKPDAAGQVPPLSERVKDKVNARTYAMVKMLEERGAINQQNLEETQVFFEVIHKEIMKMPRVQIQVAIELQDAALGMIYDYLKKEVNTRFFLDIVTKPQILAGCIVVYNGMFRDFSMHALLHDNKKDIFGPIMAKFSERMH